MKRRDFLKNMPIAVLPSILGTSMKAYGSNPMLDEMTAGLIETDRVLVIVQMSGGNDGLNTIIPLDIYSKYADIRKGIELPENKILKLKGTNGKTGIHPAMQKMWEMAEEGRLTTIQSVGYAAPSYSHFRATDIWMSASESEKTNTGWAGRYLNYEYPNFPVGFPNATMPDPVALRINSAGALAFQGAGTNMGVSINNTNDLLSLDGYLFTDPTTGDTAGQKLAYIREVQRQTDKFGDVINAAGLKQANNISTLYPTSSLSEQLKIVARLIAGGLKTRIYWVSTGGFDTHANQANALDTTTGVHATLLKGVSDSIYAFMDDCKKLKVDERVMGFTFSEFGRRIKPNGSGGTDHGAAAPMFVFGNKVKSGVIGKNVGLEDKDLTISGFNGSVVNQFDFRSIYASILHEWFCVPQKDLDGMLITNNDKLSLIDTKVCLPTATHEANVKAGDNMIMPYPNPFAESTTVKYETLGGHTLVQVVNNQGIVLQTLVDEIKDAGQYEVRCDLGFAPSGLYYVRLQNGTLQQAKPMMKIN
jgi:uncharacterized protein (DUF1501 family)